MIFNEFELCSLYCSPLDENGVVASGSGGSGGGSGDAPEAVNDDTPGEKSYAELKEQHRHIFNLRMFPSLFEGQKMKAVEDHPKSSPFSQEMTQTEWDEAINIVRNFGPRKRKYANEEQIRFRDSLPQSTMKKWTKLYEGAALLEKYKAEEYKLPGSDQTHYRLLRNHKRSRWEEKRWLTCVPQLDVYDAIYECHQMVSHMKQNQTCAKVHERYYNITEKQVNTFVETCFVCDARRQADRARKLLLLESMEQNKSENSNE